MLGGLLGLDMTACMVACMVPWVAQLGDEPLELAALDPDRAADVDDGEPMPGDLAFDATAGAAQFARLPRRE